MANPDIPAALVVLQAHLVAAGAAPTYIKWLDIARGQPIGARCIRYYWDGECPPPHMGAEDGRVLNGQMVGQKYAIHALIPLTDLTPALMAVIDDELKILAAQVRTRLQGDNDLGDHIESLDLDYAGITIVTIAGARCVDMAWDLALGYEEYTVAK